MGAYCCKKPEEILDDKAIMTMGGSKTRPIVESGENLEKPANPEEYDQMLRSQNAVVGNVTTSQDIGQSQQADAGANISSPYGQGFEIPANAEAGGNVLSSSTGVVPEANEVNQYDPYAGVAASQNPYATGIVTQDPVIGSSIQVSTHVDNNIIPDYGVPLQDTNLGGGIASTMIVQADPNAVNAVDLVQPEYQTNYIVNDGGLVASGIEGVVGSTVVDNTGELMNAITVDTGAYQGNVDAYQVAGIVDPNAGITGIY